MDFLIDADVIIDFFNGKTELFEFFQDTENKYVSVLTVGELNHKVLEYKSAKSDYDSAIDIANDFCHLLHIINVDERIAVEYGKLKAKYCQQNQEIVGSDSTSISDSKLWLCATAIIRDMVFVTNDESVTQVKEVVTKKIG